MSEPPREPSLFEGLFATVGMVAILGWVGNAIYHSDSMWLKLAALAFVGLFALMGAFIAWMMTAQWLDKRRARRAGRPWRP